MAWKASSAKVILAIVHQQKQGLDSGGVYLKTALTGDFVKGTARKQQL